MGKARLAGPVGQHGINGGVHCFVIDTYFVRTIIVSRPRAAQPFRYPVYVTDTVRWA